MKHNNLIKVFIYIYIYNFHRYVAVTFMHVTRMTMYISSCMGWDCVSSSRWRCMQAYVYKKIKDGGMHADAVGR